MLWLARLPTGGGTAPPLSPCDMFDLSPLEWKGLDDPPVRDVPFLLRMPKVRRNTFSAGNMVGRLAEIIPAAISIAVHPTVGARV